MSTPSTMDVARVVHDELLHRLEEPQAEELHREVSEVAPGKARVDLEAPDDGDAPRRPPARTSERTPLLLAGKQKVLVDADVDLTALALRLNDDERAAVEADRRAEPMQIVREESQQLARLAVPIMLVVLLEALPDTILTMMIGHTGGAMGTQILAAFSLSSLFQMLLVAGLMNGLGSAIDTLCSQAYGGKRLRELWMFMQAGLLMYAACVPFVAAALLNGSTILRALGQDPTISDIAARLLLITLASMPFSLVFSVTKSALQAQNVVSPFVNASIASWAVSLPAAYALGFWTPLGYMGIAFSTVINNAIKALWLFPVLMRNDVFRETWPGWRFTEAVRLVPRLSRLGLSSVLMLTFQLLGFSLISLLAGLLPNAAVMISANSIFASVLVLSFMPLLGICVAGAIRIGNALGAGQARRAALIGRVVMVGCVGVSSMGMFATALIADPFARTFTRDPEALKVANQLIDNLLPLIPLLGFIFGIQSIFRACGKQALCASFNFVFLFCLSVPLGIWFALKLQAGILGLWYGHFVGMIGFILATGTWLYGLSWDEMAHEARMNTHLHVVPPAGDAA